MSLQRDEYIRKKRIKLILKISLAFVALIFLLGLSAYISNRKEIRISKVELSGGVLVGQSDVGEETLRFLSGNYFWFFPRDNAFWYPKNELADDLKNNFKRIDEINIKKKNLNTLAIEISERKPFALWCESENDNCYFMDENSTIFVEAPQFSGDAYFKYYGLVSTSSPIIGQEYIASSAKFRDVAGFVSVAKRIGIKPVRLVAETDGDYTLFLSSGARIIFDMKESLSKVSSNLEILLRSGKFSTTSDPTAGVDYIDLRFGNKLFYKMK